MDGWMDGWRRPNHMRSQIGGPKAMGPVNLRRLAGEFHSVAKQASFEAPIFGVPVRFWSDFGRLSETKMEPRIDFLDAFLQSFFRMRFGIDFWSIFGSSKPEKSTKTIVFLMFFANFHKIDVFEKVAKQVRFWLRFRRPKRRKIEKQLC